jgi:hypothetical protein
VTQKKAEGEMNTARMKPRRKVAQWEQAFPFIALRRSNLSDAPGVLGTSGQQQSASL